MVRVAVDKAVEHDRYLDHQEVVVVADGDSTLVVSNDPAEILAEHDAHGHTVATGNYSANIEDAVAENLGIHNVAVAVAVAEIVVDTSCSYDRRKDGFDD